MAITTSYNGGSAAWNNVNWSNGFPNAIDTYAELNAVAGATLTIGAGLSYTLSSLYTNDNTTPYTDWVVAGSNATTSKLIFATSSNAILPYIWSIDGMNVSVGLSGSQGLQLLGGAAAGDTLTISNVNNTLYGPLQFDYGYNTTISGKLIASGTINSNNNFAGVSYTGILGLLGKVDLQTSGLNIRSTNIVGDLDPTSELTSSNGSSVTSNPSAFDNSFKISAPMVLNASNEWGTANTPNIIIEYAGVVSGVSPAANISAGNTFAVSNYANTGYVIFRLSNPNNTFTGGPPVAICADVNDTLNAQAILEYSTIANSGMPSSVGAGTTSFMTAWRSSTYRCIGAGGTSNRRLEAFGAGNTGNYSLENNGTGPIVFNNATASNFTFWPVLAGTNSDLNTISQPLYFNRPFVKDGTGRWLLSGEKRYLPVAAYNTGVKPWLTSTGKTLIEAGYSNDFISVLGGYLRFDASTVLRHQATNAIGDTVFHVYSGSALELSGASIASTYQAAATATSYGSTLILNGNGPNNDGALINLSGSNDVLSIVRTGTPAVINISTGSLRFNYYFYDADTTITGSGDVTFDQNNWLGYSNVTKNNTGLGRFAGAYLYNSTLTNTNGVLQISGSSANPGSTNGYLNVSGGITQNLTSNATRVFNGILLNTGSFVHTLNADLQLSGTILYTNTTASNVFSYSSPAGRVLKLTGGAGFGASANKSGSMNLLFDYNGSNQSNIITEANSLLILEQPYSSSTGYGFNKNGAGTVKLMSSASYLGTNSLLNGTTVPKHQNAFGRSSLIIQGGTLSTSADMHVQIQSNLTLNGGTVSFGSNV